MKRELEEQRQQRSNSTGSSSSSSDLTAAKKQKVNQNDDRISTSCTRKDDHQNDDDDIDTSVSEPTSQQEEECQRQLQPQLHLMPITPALPPVVPLSVEEEADLKKKYRYKYQTPPNKVYKSKDYNLWPKVATNVFASQKTIHNPAYASEYIRYWFAEHHGLRAQPPKASRSAYATYYNDQKSGWCAKHGQWNQKRDSKKIGTLWKTLTDDERKVCETQFANSVAQHTVNTNFWHEEAVKWRFEKLQRLQAKGEELDPEKRVALKLSKICVCELCKPTT